MINNSNHSATILIKNGGFLVEQSSLIIELALMLLNQKILLIVTETILYERHSGDH